MDKKIKESLMEYYKEFIKSFDDKSSKECWEKQKKFFMNFWDLKILPEEGELTEEEMIPVIQILDSKGKTEKGKTKRQFEGTANTTIYQIYWYEVLKGIKSSEKTKVLLNKLFKSEKSDEEADLINQISYNEEEIRFLTGKNGNVINALMFTTNPEENISVVSLSDRYKFLNFLGIDKSEFENLTYGEKMISTRNRISSIKNELGINISNRGFCTFLYSEDIRRLWKDSLDEEIEDEDKVELLEDDKQIIFYGPPGTGKTYYTKEFIIEIINKSYKFPIFNALYENHPELLEDPNIKPGAKCYRPLNGLTRPLVAFKVKNKVLLKRDEIINMFSWHGPSTFIQRIRLPEGFGLMRFIDNDTLQLEPDGLDMINGLISDGVDIDKIFNDSKSEELTGKQKTTLIKKLSEIDMKKLTLITNHILCFMRYCLLFDGPVSKTNNIDSDVEEKIKKCFGTPRGSDDAPTNVVEWGLEYCRDLSLADVSGEDDKYKYYKLTKQGISVLKAIEKNILKKGV